MERTSCKTDFQSWKGIMALKLLCCNYIAAVPVTFSMYLAISRRRRRLFSR